MGEACGVGTFPEDRVIQLAYYRGLGSRGWDCLCAPDRRGRQPFSKHPSPSEPLSVKSLGFRSFQEINDDSISSRSVITNDISSSLIND